MNQQELQDLHEETKRNLHIKLARIPPLVFLLGKPTITDFYYQRTDKIKIQGIPYFYQLDMYFKRYNDFVAQDFKAKKQNHHAPVSRAVWYYQTDKFHNFSRHHERVRWNILLAAILATSKEPEALCASPDAKKFSEAFLDAWINAMIRDNDTMDQETFVRTWQQGEFDLVFFPDKQRRAMDKAIRNLKADMPAMPCSVDDFLDKAQNCSKEQLRAHGPAWALQWALNAESEIVTLEQIDKAAAVAKDGGLENAFGGMGIQEEDVHLTPELFRLPMVEAINTEIDLSRVVDREYTKGERCLNWMDPQTAVDLVSGNLAKYLDMTDVFAGIKLMQS